MSDESEVRAVIAEYFDALYHGDVAKFRQVLHPLVRLTSATDGVLVLDRQGNLRAINPAARALLGPSARRWNCPAHWLASAAWRVCGRRWIKPTGRAAGRRRRARSA